MKMGFFFTGTFWGIILILAGISVLLKVFFQVDLPVFRIVFGLIVIAWGIHIITGRSVYQGHKDEANIVFSEGDFTPNDKNKYNVVFGKATTDLTALAREDLNAKIEINTVFAENTVLIDAKTPAHIVVNSVFAGAFLPDGNSAAMGTYHYKSPGLEKAKNYLRIEANVVFGSLKIVLK